MTWMESNLLTNFETTKSGHGGLREFPRKQKVVIVRSVGEEVGWAPNRGGSGGSMGGGEAT